MYGLWYKLTFYLRSVYQIKKVLVENKKNTFTRSNFMFIIKNLHHTMVYVKFEIKIIEKISNRNRDIAIQSYFNLTKKSKCVPKTFCQNIK